VIFVDRHTFLSPVFIIPYNQQLRRSTTTGFAGPALTFETGRFINWSIDRFADELSKRFNESANRRVNGIETPVNLSIVPVKSIGPLLFM